MNGVSDYSLNESAYRAKLAVRGVGYSWGVAEDGARALYWLSSRGLDGFAALSAVLTDIDSNLLGAPAELCDTWTGEQTALCPLMTGLCISDCADQVIDMHSIKLINIAYPVLILPFLSDVACAHNCTLEFTCSEFSAAVNHEAVAILGDCAVASTNTAAVSCSEQLIESSDPTYKYFSKSKNRVNIDASVWHQLGVFAHRTYAPATEQSRLLGAGAGIVDSD